MFINTSRGEAICEKSLLKALKSKRIKKASLDVVANEQGDLNKNILINYSKKNENLIITPHIAGCTIESETKAAQQCYNILESYRGAYL